MRPCVTLMYLGNKYIDLETARVFRAAYTLLQIRRSRA
jgi:hypothetical protein